MAVETITEEFSYIVKFAKPFIFEGQEYEEIDLSGLSDLTGRDLKMLTKAYNRDGNITVVPYFEWAFNCAVCVRVTGLPAEFFDELPIREANKINARVIAFFTALS